MRLFWTVLFLIELSPCLLMLVLEPLATTLRLGKARELAALVVLIPAPMNVFDEVRVDVMFMSSTSNKQDSSRTKKQKQNA